MYCEGCFKWVHCKFFSISNNILTKLCKNDLPSFCEDCDLNMSVCYRCNLACKDLKNCLTCFLCNKKCHFECTTIKMFYTNLKAKILYFIVIYVKKLFFRFRMLMILTSGRHGVHKIFFGVHETFRVHQSHLGVHKVLRLHKKFFCHNIIFI